MVQVRVGTELGLYLGALSSEMVTKLDSDQVKVGKLYRVVTQETVCCEKGTKYKAHNNLVRLGDE